LLKIVNEQLETCEKLIKLVAGE